MLLPEQRWPDPALAQGERSGWRIGEIEIDTTLAQVSRAGRKLVLERSGYELLRHLVENAGRTLGKDELLRAGWPGRMVSENSLAKAIGKLRLALGDEQAQLIQAVHGYGYRLVAVVEALPPRQLEIAPAPVAPFAAPVARPFPWRGASASVLLLLTIALLLSWWRPSVVMPPPSKPLATVGEDVIAVLPLRDLSPSGSLGLLADGFANYLRDQLQRMPALRIVNRADSHALRGDQREPAEIARDLGANLIVDGELSLVDDRLRVVLRLSDASGRIPGWSQTFERAPQDQAQLLQDLGAALYAGLGNQPQRWGYDPQRGRGTANEDAYRTFLRAATLFGGNNDPNSQRRTLAILEQAVEIDPDYADAWLMLGGILGGSGYYADTAEELVAGRVRAIAATDRGIARVPDDPSNYLARSEMRLLYFFDVPGAWADVEAAAARLPGGESPALLVWKARLLASTGRIDEAIATGARAIALDPASGARRNQGWHYLAKGDTRNARAVLMLQLADLPENPHTNFYLALCDIFEGQPDAALRRLEHSSTLFRLVGTVIAQHEKGDRAASDIALQKLTDQFAIADGYWVGAAHAWRGEIDQAFHWIERAIRGGDSSAMYLPFDPLVHNLRGDRRYAQSLAAMNLGD
jgi:DNA-binding winged helix-turn-helix (wHTH) protein/TolB-like protein